jgi:lipoprotein-anchoring transpeptidase ErfK/SrfK
MTRVAQAAAAAAAIFAVSLPIGEGARAEIVVRIDKSSQRMSVIVNGEHRYTWAVSTGVGGTPSGTFRPQSLSRNHRSALYGGAPMPYSIFYSGNFAIHGTNQISRLGGPASHGCVRLHPSNAAVLFALVQRDMGGTSIHIR